MVEAGQFTVLFTSYNSEIFHIQRFWKVKEKRRSVKLCGRLGNGEVRGQAGVLCEDSVLKPCPHSVPTPTGFPAASSPPLGLAQASAPASATALGPSVTHVIVDRPHGPSAGCGVGTGRCTQSPGLGLVCVHLLHQFVAPGAVVSP